MLNDELSSPLRGEALGLCCLYLVFNVYLMLLLEILFDIDCFGMLYSFFVF